MQTVGFDGVLQSGHCLCGFVIVYDDTSLCIIMFSEVLSQYLHSMLMYIAAKEPDDNLALIIGLTVGLGALLIILILVLILCCCIPSCPLYGKCCKKGEFFTDSFFVIHVRKAVC